MYHRADLPGESLDPLPMHDHDHEFDPASQSAVTYAQEGPPSGRPFEF
jgi:hypothetical protein